MDRDDCAPGARHRSLADIGSATVGPGPHHPDARSARIRRARVRCARLRRAQLRRAQLRCAQLRCAKLCRAKLRHPRNRYAPGCGGLGGSRLLHTIGGATPGPDYVGVDCLGLLPPDAEPQLHREPLILWSHRDSLAR
ncbi:pentapeptide repeat-containing protein [Catenulispora sp. NF23]|uniref:pentapeptide repeat-containing protein n=1 Tax=Catenulispora pinistramenti TaxID=2705254 RepID=UPI001BA6D543|nr:pentapeptide repeat-containing protein [Catenulispora pinistramenti]